MLRSTGRVGLPGEDLGPAAQFVHVVTDVVAKHALEDLQVLTPPFPHGDVVALHDEQCDVAVGVRDRLDRELDRRDSPCASQPRLASDRFAGSRAVHRLTNLFGRAAVAGDERRLVDRPAGQRRPVGAGEHGRRVVGRDDGAVRAQQERELEGVVEHRLQALEILLALRDVAEHAVSHRLVGEFDGAEVRLHGHRVAVDGRELRLRAVVQRRHHAVGSLAEQRLIRLPVRLGE